MIIISCCNRKGGSGKSTTAVAVGSYLHLKGYRVLFVDLDSQGNLSQMIGIDSDNQNALNALVEPSTIKSNIVTSLIGVDTLPYIDQLAVINTSTFPKDEYQLKKALEQVQYDVAIVDTSPSLDLLTTMSLVASDFVIIPLKADKLSIIGAQKLIRSIDVVKSVANRDIKVAGLLVTDFDGRSNISKAYLEQIKTLADDLNIKCFSPIRHSVKILEAQYLQQNIYIYAPKNNAVMDYKAFTEELLTIIGI